MKTILLLLVASTALLSLPSCKSPAQSQFDLSPERLANIGNFAITAASIGGVINDTQAKAIRKGGKLVLDAHEGKPTDLAVLSDAIVDYAEQKGSITPEQADALRKAGTVDLAAASRRNVG